MYLKPGARSKQRDRGRGEAHVHTVSICMCIYIYIYMYNVYIYIYMHVVLGYGYAMLSYGQFSKCHVCFCGQDPGNLKFETVRTTKQHTYF